MGLSISGIPTSGVSNLYVQQPLLDQIDADQAAMLAIETQLSTRQATVGRPARTRSRPCRS